MAVILSHVFSCCLSRKPSKSKIQDEESHLIPPNTEITPSYSSSPGHQTFKERMLDIVRSKESKMVNISSKLPFHFGNKNQESIASDGGGAESRTALTEPFSTSPTYSRSVSASSLPRDVLSPRPFLPLSPMYESQFNGDDHSASGSRARSSRSPAFNIRLVRGLCRHVTETSRVRRGRPRKKADSENDDAGGTDDLLSGIPSQQAQNASQTESPETGGDASAALVNTEFAATQIPRGDSPPDLDIGPLIISWDD